MVGSGEGAAANLTPTAASGGSNAALSSDCTPVTACPPLSCEPAGFGIGDVAALGAEAGAEEWRIEEGLA